MFRTGRTIALYVATRVSVVKPLLDPSKAFLTLKALLARSATIAGLRAKGVVGVQRDAQDFKGSHLWGGSRTGWVVVVD